MKKKNKPENPLQTITSQTNGVEVPIFVASNISPNKLYKKPLWWVIYYFKKLKNFLRTIGQSKKFFAVQK